MAFVFGLCLGNELSSVEGNTRSRRHLALTPKSMERSLN